MLQCVHCCCTLAAAGNRGLVGYTNGFKVGWVYVVWGFRLVVRGRERLCRDAAGDDFVDAATDGGDTPLMLAAWQGTSASL